MYTHITEWSTEDSCFISRVLEFPSLSAFGDTREEASKELNIVLRNTLKWMEKDGEKAPTEAKDKITEGVIMKEQNLLEDGWFYHNHAWHLLHEYLKLIREVDGAKSLLDVGAGTGLAAAVIRGVFPDIKVYVSDVEKKCVNFWKKRNIPGTVDELSLSYFGTADVVLSSHVLEHIEDPIPFIKRLFNLTKKRLIIAVPDGDVRFYDHKVIYDRAKLEKTIREALDGEKYIYKGFPVYHAHMNNLVAVVGKHD